jgi:hypothetical protein
MEGVKMAKEGITELRARVNRAMAQSRIDQAQREIELAATVADQRVRGMIIHSARGKLHSAYELLGLPAPASWGKWEARVERLCAPMRNVRVTGGGVR